MLNAKQTKRLRRPGGLRGGGGDTEAKHRRRGGGVVTRRRNTDGGGGVVTRRRNTDGGGGRPGGETQTEGGWSPGGETPTEGGGVDPPPWDCLGRLMGNSRTLHGTALAAGRFLIGDSDTLEDVSPVLLSTPQGCTLHPARLQPSWVHEAPAGGEGQPLGLSPSHIAGVHQRIGVSIFVEFTASVCCFGPVLLHIGGWCLWRPSASASTDATLVVLGSFSEAVAKFVPPSSFKPRSLR